MWLEIADILTLVVHAQTNSGSGDSLDVPWLDGVMPVNHWVAAFDRSVATTSEWGRLHIAIVNTEVSSSLTPFAQGRHWIVIAWKIDLED